MSVHWLVDVYVYVSDLSGENVKGGVYGGPSAEAREDSGSREQSNVVGKKYKEAHLLQPVQRVQGAEPCSNFHLIKPFSTSHFRYLILYLLLSVLISNCAIRSGANVVKENT